MGEKKDRTDFRLYVEENGEYKTIPMLSDEDIEDLVGDVGGAEEFSGVCEMKGGNFTCELEMNFWQKIEFRFRLWLYSRQVRRAFRKVGRCVRREMKLNEKLRKETEKIERYRSLNEIEEKIDELEERIKELSGKEVEKQDGDDHDEV